MHDLNMTLQRRLMERLSGVWKRLRRNVVFMTEVSLAWLLTKVTAPVVGATKTSHVDGAVKAVDLELTEYEISYLEELYVPHALAGVMAQNGKQKAGNVV